jgi:hypothetical protein
MQHVLWIGGPPAAGKTTVATLLARRHGLRLYRADTRTWVHRDRALAERHAAALRWESLSPGERWERSTLAEMVEMSLQREREPMVIDDLRALPEAPLILAEGTTLPAWAVSSGLAPRSQAVWLLPTAQFQDAQLAALGTTGGRLTLYRHLREVTERDALEHDVPALVVDGSQGAAEIADAVQRMFAATLAAGPVAVTRQERRRLLRELNEAVAAQVRGYCERPWADADPDVITDRFVCECGEPACDAVLTRRVGEATTAPVLAPGHGNPRDTRRGGRG